MMIARWQFDAKFGRKDEAIRLLKEWHEIFGAQIGWTKDKVRMFTGSVGVAESRIVSEVMVKDLAELNAAWEKLATLEGRAEWQKRLEPVLVSGSNHWEVYRTI